MRKGDEDGYVNSVVLNKHGLHIFYLNIEGNCGFFTQVLKVASPEFCCIYLFQ